MASFHDGQSNENSEHLLQPIDSLLSDAPFLGSYDFDSLTLFPGSERHEVNGLVHEGAVDEHPLEMHGVVADAPATLEDFFTNSGAWRPSEPCAYCKQMRLQCFFLQTTSANPNPVTSCSSCVALFRNCSLAEKGKRHPLHFETPEPVIGQLHGVSEEDTGSSFLVTDSIAVAGVSSSRRPTSNNKRASSRSVRKTRVLRHWFTTHADAPYPSDEEKASLAKQSGLSKTQVANWFTNARRRQRSSARVLAGTNFFAQGSPMPQSSFADMTPLERWRSSPPDEEAVSSAVIELALGNFVAGNGSSEPSNNSGATGCASSASGDLSTHSQWHDASSNSTSSCYSHMTTDNYSMLSLPIGSFEDSTGATSQSAGAAISRPPSGSRSASTFLYQCTFCHDRFKKKSDWVRHERSVHLRGSESWICAIPLPAAQPHQAWRFGESHPECILCGQPSPSDDHFQSHEFFACAERSVEERTFVRKDHLWQHLYKFHGCRKWDGWTPDLRLLHHKRDAMWSRCGFCQAEFDSWDRRVEHLAAHFRAGLSMAQWVGDPGMHEVSLSAMAFASNPSQSSEL